MRKVVAGLFISLDGVVEAPEKWGFSYFTEGLNKTIAKSLDRADAVLLGPQTYHIFAQMWPPQGNEVPMAKFLNESPKYVITDNPNSAGELEWQPATLLKGMLAEEIRHLKSRPGKNIQVPGSPRLVRSLLAEGLLDELYLSICPVVIGQGLKLFDGISKTINLDMVQSQIFDNGLISVTYRPKSSGAKPGESTHFPEAAKASIK
ncbi:bifunctional deaminase-reductase domain protein [candidate division TM7 genomosp. GTL1]|nr:bifunctional deaminase-reductase domain protein [candidate division TM7 genomosp. GTL1]